MNLAVRKELFSKVGGYNTALGPHGDRPEVKSWNRLGAEETDLVLRISRDSKKMVLFNPRMKLLHKLRRESVSSLAMMRRAMHVGLNKAYISSKYGHDDLESDCSVLTNLYSELANALLKFSKEPLFAWQRFSFSIFILWGLVWGT